MKTCYNWIEGLGDIMNNVFKIVPETNFESYRERVQQGIYRDVSLVLAVIDSVYSIASKYESTIKVVNRFAELVNIERGKDDYICSEFLNKFENLTDDELANDIFDNRQRTSTTNGILKAGAVKQIIRIFKDNNIETKHDLLNHSNIDGIKKQVQKVKGQGSGISFEYIMMHAGDLNRFKPDRHIYTFFEKLLNYGPLTEDRLREVFFKELDIVKEKYSYFTARSFDSLIWEFIKFNQ